MNPLDRGITHAAEGVMRGVTFGPLAEIVEVGLFLDPPSPYSDDKPTLIYWHTEGGPLPWYDAINERMGGWSMRALREMSLTFHGVRAYDS